MEQERDRNGVRRELDQRLPLRVGPAPLDGADADEAEREPGHAGAEKRARKAAADAVLGRVEEEHQQQHHRHEQPEDVEQADDPPRQVRQLRGSRDFRGFDCSCHAPDCIRAPGDGVPRPSRPRGRL